MMDDLFIAGQLALVLLGFCCGTVWGIIVEDWWTDHKEKKTDG